MNRPIIVALIAALLLLAFGGAAYFYRPNETTQTETAATSSTAPLVRPHAVVLGEESAPVTIVEFFDPACEACRAFHPHVKKILEKYAGSVRVVIRYAAFHHGSDQAVRILETARLQGLFEPVLEALLAAQPTWASHDAPNINLAWEAAASAGLDVPRARKEILLPDITAVLIQDTADIKTIGVRQTPTFFVNGKPLQSFGPEQLEELVQKEIELAKK